MSICEYCGVPFDKDNVEINTICVVNFKDNIYEFPLKVCYVCYGQLGKLNRDIQDRFEFPKDNQIVLYKIKKYQFPSKKRKTELEDWKLFSPLRKRGNNSIYQ